MDEGFSECCPCGDGRLCNYLWGPRLYRISLDRSISASRRSREVPATSRMDFCSSPCHNDFRRHRCHRVSARSAVVSSASVFVLDDAEFDRSLMMTSLHPLDESWSQPLAALRQA